MVSGVMRAIWSKSVFLTDSLAEDHAHIHSYPFKVSKWKFYRKKKKDCRFPQSYLIEREVVM